MNKFIFFVQSKYILLISYKTLLFWFDTIKEYLKIMIWYFKNCKEMVKIVEIWSWNKIACRNDLLLKFGHRLHNGMGPDVLCHKHAVLRGRSHHHQLCYRIRVRMNTRFSPLRIEAPPVLTTWVPCIGTHGSSLDQIYANVCFYTTSIANVHKSKKNLQL